MPHTKRGPFVFSSAPTFDNPDWLTSLDDYANLYSKTTLNIEDPDFGASAAASAAWNTSAIQETIDAAESDGIAAVVLPGKKYEVGALTQKQRVALIGTKSQAANSTEGTILLGTTGTNILTLEEGFDSYVDISGISFLGGKNQIVSNELTTFVYIDNCVFSSPSEACIRVLTGSIEEWQLSNIRASGGQYFYKHDNVAGAASGNYIDKVHFFNCHTGGQSVNNYRIEVDLANTVLWTNPVLNTSGQHGVYVTGGSRTLTFVNVNTEGIGQTGKQDRTTGSISVGSPTLTVASGTGYANGDTVTVAGAGANGTDLTATANSVVGTTITLSSNAATAVTNAAVTNAPWDEFHFGTFLDGNPSRINFFGGQIGGAGTNSKIRYAINAAQAFDVNLYGVQHNDSPAVIYDPLKTVSAFGGVVQIRRPAGVAQTLPLFNHDGIKPTTKAGVPTDADFAQTPPDGTVVVDTTNSKIYARIGGTWKSTAALT